MDGADAVVAVRRPWHSWTAHLTLHPGLSGGFPQISPLVLGGCYSVVCVVGSETTETVTA